MGKLIGNLITGDHVVPKPAMPLQKKVALITTIIVVIALGSFLVWKFINYREESRVTHFLEQLAAGQYEQAYASWDAGDSYKMKDFLDDFGREGYYTKGMRQARVATSTGAGGEVIVCVQLDTLRKLLPLLVSKESLKLSFSPQDKCN